MIKKGEEQREQRKRSMKRKREKRTDLVLGVDGVDSVGLAQQSASMGDVDSCLLLVSCQHPELDPCLP